MHGALDEIRGAVAEETTQRRELEERVAALTEVGPETREPEEAQSDIGVQMAGERQQREWRPPRRDHGIPDAGVVTLDKQPDEEQALGPAAPLVAEWRG